MAAKILFPLLCTLATVRAQQRASNISLGSSLSPTGNSSWLSPSGLFAFGFFPNGNGFAVGIWYATIAQKTVIWTANRDDPPITSNASLVLTIEGRLVLQQGQDQEIYISNASLSASFASILDSGNFVLHDADSRVIWQSFDYPTDTLLPGQLLPAGSELVSSISATNHSTGSFQVVVQHDGNVVFYPVRSAAVAAYAYWDTKTSLAGDNATLTLDANGHLYLLNTTGVDVWNKTNGENSRGRETYRVTIDADGILRLYSFNFDQNGNWSIEWFIPDDRCDPKGICGVNAYCVHMNLQPVCYCPPGYAFIDPAQNNLGCNRNFSAESCVSKNENISYIIVELKNTTWYDGTYSYLSSVTKEECVKACLKDCNCEVALFEGQQCRKQQLPLMFGKGNVADNTIALVKVGIGDSPSGNGQTTVIARRGRNAVQLRFLVAGIASLTFALIILAISGVLFSRYSFTTYNMIFNQPHGGLVEDVALRSFTYEELERATNGFAEELGRGAFGTVFRGALPNTQKLIAVKKLEKMAAEGEVEFGNEMRSIGRTHHKNLVRLLGYCNDKSNRLLVYQYMHNGSLADFLFKSNTKPSWEERIGIALNIARGIHYLHEECEAQIIHCDINPNNILMDEHRCPKISDFGLAKLMMPEQSRILTEIRGTRGYVAPEWHLNQPITAKADVYSFGIVFFEVICCRRSVSLDVPENEAVLAEWASTCFETNELSKLVSSEEVDDEQALHRMIRVGLWCIQEDPSTRPSMKKVVLMLEGSVEIPVPPSPASFNSIV